MQPTWEVTKQISCLTLLLRGAPEIEPKSTQIVDLLLPSDNYIVQNPRTQRERGIEND